MRAISLLSRMVINLSTTNLAWRGPVKGIVESESVYIS